MIYRVTARGLLKLKNRILFIEYNINNHIYYALPGGKQEVGESLIQCVQREFMEETSLEIRVGNLISVREFIGDYQDTMVGEWRNGVHQIENIFEVNMLNEESNLSFGATPDIGAISLKWLDPNELHKVKKFPNYSTGWFFNRDNSKCELYSLENH